MLIVSRALVGKFFRAKLHNVGSGFVAIGDEITGTCASRVMNFNYAPAQ